VTASPDRGGGAVTCTGPSCSRPAVAHSLCASHYRQRRLRGDGADLSPLRPPVGQRGEGERLTVTVAPATASRLRSEGRPASVARRVLDGWAAGS